MTSTTSTTSKPATTRRRAGHGASEEPDLVRAYLDEIGTTPLLTATEEVDLAKRIEAGVFAAELLRKADAGEEEPAAGRRDLETVARDGLLAKDHMVRANLRLVVTAARKNRNMKLPLLDAIQEGNLGLIRAVEKFDYAKGFKFSTYAMWWIRQAIQRGNAFQASTIRLPMHTAEQLAKLDRLERNLQAQSQQDPSVEELAAAANMPVERVVALRRAGQSTVSLDVPLDEDGELKLGDLVAADSVPGVGEALEYQGMVADLHAALDTLPALEASVLSLRYGLTDGHPHTVPEIAQRLSVTRKRVRTLEQRGMEVLRDAQHRKPLLEWAS
ncbi:RNA polymerase subunit sigma [Prauserella marina]|uniref:RNA polymerase primary sigma factor/RNA polymerase nonessential primary-like sigma factor n=1 Tax=Prauserella marina TaxID=530584 RepID=A0A222VN22_9PSEU|nr:sigma-70 family RNA polymerase sigma factor [Prauserella marina]ASR35315.1 RNA polymerase subunit sigma [Prauserella marina]PWV84900.1 RNA polymerase primary sigma factor/RNA polymerase nonessential primary-like sigma factor [Prauserella marina]SDC10016.1 RNA polymerase primary sigma factor/RNA polymerase nonessential primary-like sigma factor [Prauserella marina]